MTEATPPSPEVTVQNPTPAEPEKSWSEIGWDWIKMVGGMATDPVLAAVDHVIVNRKAILRWAKYRFGIGLALMLVGVALGAHIDHISTAVIGRLLVAVGGGLMFWGYQVAAIGITAATAWGLGLIALIDLIPGEGFEIIKRKLAEAGLQGQPVGDGNIRFVNDKKEKLSATFSATQTGGLYIATLVFALWLWLSWEMLGILLGLGWGGMIVVGLMVLDGQEVGHFRRAWIRALMFGMTAMVGYVLLNAFIPDFVVALKAAGNIGPKMAAVLNGWVAGKGATIATVGVITFFVLSGFGILALLRRLGRPIDTVPQRTQREEIEKVRAGQVVVHSTVSGPSDRSMFKFGLIAALIIAAISFFALDGVERVYQWAKRHPAPAISVTTTQPVEVRHVYYNAPYVPPTTEQRTDQRRARRTARRDADDAADQRGADRIRASLRDNFGP